LGQGGDGDRVASRKKKKKILSGSKKREGMGEGVPAGGKNRDTGSGVSQGGVLGVCGVFLGGGGWGSFKKSQPKGGNETKRSRSLGAGGKKLLWV